MKIHDAARKGDVEALRALLAAGAAIDAKDKEGNTPFLLAAQLGNVEALAFLRDAKADMHARNAVGYNALMLAAQTGQHEAVRWLLANRADPFGSAPNGFNALLVAASNLATMKTFHEAGVDLNRGNPNRGITPLMFSAQQGHLDVMRFLLDVKADVNLKDNLGMTALDRAKKSGHKEIVRILAERMGQTAPAKKTPQQKQAERKLCKAAAKGNLADIEALLREGVPVDARDSEDYTPLMRAAEQGRTEAARLLLKAGADPKARTDNTRIDALYIACADGHIDIARELLARGVDVNATDPDSGTCYTALMASVLSANVELVRLLVEAGADMQAQDFSGRTAYHWAREQKAKAVMRYLKEHGGAPKPREPKNEPLPEPVVAKDPSDIVQVARAEKKNFPIAASKPTFQKVLKFLAKATGKTPVESSKRAGVYLLGLGRKAFAALATHFKLPAPTFRERAQEADHACSMNLLNRLQADVRERGFLLMVDSLYNLDEPVKLWLYPTANPYAVLSSCGTNGANYGIMTRQVILWLDELAQTHPWILTACGNAVCAGDFLKPVADAKLLARKMYKFCPDIVDQGTETVQALAKGLAERQDFFFWWD